MPVHEQRESGSRGGAGSGRRSARNGGGNEQSNYQAVASETIFLLRFLSPSAPQACKTFSTHTYIYVCVCVYEHTTLSPVSTSSDADPCSVCRMRITVSPKNWKIRVH